MMRRLVQWLAARAGLLQWVAIIAGLFSAYFWWKSVWVTFPALEMYWGAMPPTAPYQVAINAAAFWNTLAAFSAAVAAGAEALALLLARFRRVR
jgi:hypothetical protein